MFSRLRHSERCVDIAVIMACLVAIWLAYALRSFAYFRDYSITFEGSYRLLLGQIPYRDFGTPVGPVSFVLPALFFKLFGANWTVFLLTQQFENVALLLLIHGLLRKLQVRPLVRHLSLLAYTLFYLLLLSHPWYNTTGVMLMLAATWLAMHNSAAAAAGAGLLAGLAILCKQDFGLLTLLIAGFYVALVRFGSDLTTIAPDLKQLKNAALWRATGVRLAAFFAPAVLVVVVFILATDPAQFGYWFNYGQPPHDRRSISLKDLLGNSFGTLGTITAIIALLRNNLRLLTAAIFLTAASVSRTTSGLGFTHYYFVAFIPVIVDEFLRLKIRWKELLLIVVTYASMRVMIRPATDLYRELESIVLGKPEHFFFDHRLLSRPLAPMPASLQAFSVKTQAPQETIDAISELKQLATRMRERNAGAALRVLNMTELTPIYAELGAQPPTGLPLWFHTKVSLFPEQIQKMDAILSSETYDLILIQGTHEGLTETYHAFLATLRRNPAYSLLRTVPSSPANATWPCEPDCQGDIFVFAKKS